MREKPSAMPTPTRSWRHRIGRMSMAAQASITGIARIAGEELGPLALEDFGDDVGAVHSDAFSVYWPSG